MKRKSRNSDAALVTKSSGLYSYCSIIRSWVLASTTTFGILSLESFRSPSSTQS